MKKVEEIYMWIVVAGLAGVANYLHNITSNGKPFVLLHLISRLFSAALSGYVTASVAVSYGMDVSIIGALVGVSGWSGTIILDELTKAMAKLLPELLLKTKLAIQVIVTDPPKEEQRQEIAFDDKKEE